MALRAARVLAATAAATVLVTAAEASITPRRGPQRLADTGLYSDFASRRVDPRNLHYGVEIDQEVAPGKHHRIPSVADCVTCHRGGRSEVLGFGALELSPDRDPLAPHSERPSAGDVDLRTLVQRGLVRHLPERLVKHPPRIAADTPTGRAAMGYLHANCGICHDSAGPLASLGLDLRHLVRSPTASPEPALAAVLHPSRFQVPGPSGHASVWILPGNSAQSAVTVRMASRNRVAQMPPLGTQVVDEEALSIVRRWIQQDVHGPSRDAQIGSISRNQRRRTR